jgi:hypothetical protein
MEGKADEESIKEIMVEAKEIRERWYATRKLRVRGSLGLTRPINTLTWLSLAEELMRLFKYIKAEGVDAVRESIVLRSAFIKRFLYSRIAIKKLTLINWRILRTLQLLMTGLRIWRLMMEKITTISKVWWHSKSKFCC